MKLIYPLLITSLLLGGCSVFKTPPKKTGQAWADDVVGQQIKADHEKNERSFKKSKRLADEK